MVKIKANPKQQNHNDTPQNSNNASRNEDQYMKICMKNRNTLPQSEALQSNPQIQFDADLVKRTYWLMLKDHKFLLNMCIQVADLIGIWGLELLHKFVLNLITNFMVLFNVKSFLLCNLWTGTSTRIWDPYRLAMPRATTGRGTRMIENPNNGLNYILAYAHQDQKTNYLTLDEIANPIMMVIPMFNVEPVTLFLSLREWLLVHMNVTTEALYNDDFEDDFPPLPSPNVGMQILHSLTPGRCITTMEVIWWKWKVEEGS
ncbi:hypothetical protein L1987_50012 [Smallanthus sonchifolius]|uniref:Uncharacterized protein n=1 Tax=Smallanthus sonchifolius TaxID=185202 RepID=A0ACB9FXB3_9ASTR|nr:hypothetical protein L1987_50012 [Smallanthus sonchifolius]